MGGFSRALWLWLPVLIYKAVSAFFRTIWKLNLWILQTVSGVPLYYCRPEYRIPGIALGTFGVFLMFNLLCFIFVLGSASGNDMPQSIMSPGHFLMTGLLGGVFLILCRLLIRRGSI